MAKQLINQFIIIVFHWHIIHKVWPTVLLATLLPYCESWHDIVINQENTFQADHE